MADDDSAASTSTNTTSDPSALGEALGSISAVPTPTPPKPVNVAVKVKQEDVALVMEQFELSKPKATDALRKNGGDVVATLRALVTA